MSVLQAVTVIGLVVWGLAALAPAILEVRRLRRQHLTTYRARRGSRYNPKENR